MSRNPDVSRRHFLGRTAIGAGAGALSALYGDQASAQSAQGPTRLPREVWIATFSLMGLEAEDHHDVSRQVLAEMESIASLQPDVICLPEYFLFARGRRRAPIAEVAEEPLGPLSRPFAEYARRHGCYVVCPTFIRDGSRIYNSALVIDRKGQLLGEYRKMRPTEDEMAAGISPGPPDPPVFHADFGVIGAQICFDIEWADGWRRLREKGAEIVFWPSAFAGGMMVNTAAWQHKVCVVSSTHKDTSRICDVSGEELARTGRWSPQWAHAPVNLEKVFLHTWPYNRHFDDIRAKYGRKVRVTNFDEEEWTILESRSADVRVADLMKEFDLRTHEQTMQGAERLHRAAWGTT